MQGSSRIWFLLSRKLSSEATLDEQRELELHLLAYPNLATKLEVYENFFVQKSKPDLGKDELQEAWEKQLKIIELDDEEGKTIQVIPSKKRNRIYWWAIAASITVIAFWGVGSYFPERSSDKNFAEHKVESKKGVKTRHILPDGSVVWLNNESSLAYNAEYGKTNREIQLIGEAFFDVIHKAELPMIVHAGSVDVKVKGTAFNVKCYPGDGEISASLIRGSIELSARVNNTEEKLILKPNEKVVAKLSKNTSNNVTLAVATLEIDTLKVEEQSGLIPEISWIQDKMVFVNEPLNELAKKMRHWYKVEIVIADSSLNSERFTGSFQSESLDDVLEALKYSYGLHYTKEKGKIILNKK